MTVGINHFLIISALMLGLGLYSVITGRHLWKVFAGLLLLFAAPLLNIAAVSGLNAFSAGSQITLFVISVLILILLAYGVSLMIMYHKAYGTYELDKETEE